MGTKSNKLNVNGELYSATQTKISVNGDYRYGIMTITFKDDIEKSLVFGTGRNAIGYTTGNYTPTCSFEIVKHEGDLLLRDLARAAKAYGPGAGIVDVPFNITAKWVPNGTVGKLPLSGVEILGATIKSKEQGIQKGGDAAVWKIELLVVRPIRMSVNGEAFSDIPDPLLSGGGGLVPAGSPVGV